MLLLGSLACCVAILISLDAASCAWLVAQLTHSVAPTRLAMAAWLEDWAWRQWEDRGAAHSIPMPVAEVLASASSADLGLPFIVRGLLNGSAALANGTSWLRALPVGAVVVPYYSDASSGALWPDAEAPIAEVVDAIEAGGPQKLGTELIFRQHPELLETLGLTPPLARLFGRAPFARWRIGSLLTVPLFLGTGAADGATRVRTDFHSEPIGTAAGSDSAPWLDCDHSTPCVRAWWLPRPRPHLRGPEHNVSGSASLPWPVEVAPCSSARQRHAAAGRAEALDAGPGRPELPAAPLALGGRVRHRAPSPRPRPLPFALVVSCICLSLCQPRERLLVHAPLAVVPVPAAQARLLCDASRARRGWRICARRRGCHALRGGVRQPGSSRADPTSETTAALLLARLPCKLAR